MSASAERHTLPDGSPWSSARVTPGPDMMQWFGLTRPEPTYGRLALIHCDGKPAIELVEIVAPE